MRVPNVCSYRMSTNYSVNCALPQFDRAMARAAGGNDLSFTAIARLDTPVEVDYYRNGGILPAVLRKLAQG